MEDKIDIYWTFLPVWLHGQFDYERDAMVDGRVCIFLRERYRVPKGIASCNIRYRGFTSYFKISDYTIKGRPTDVFIKRRVWCNILTGETFGQPINLANIYDTITDDIHEFLFRSVREYLLPQVIY